MSDSEENATTSAATPANDDTEDVDRQDAETGDAEPEVKTSTKTKNVEKSKTSSAKAATSKEKKSASNAKKPKPSSEGKAKVAGEREKKAGTAGAETKTKTEAKAKAKRTPMTETKAKRSPAETKTKSGAERKRSPASESKRPSVAKRSKPAHEGEDENEEDEPQPKKRAKKAVPVASRNDEDGGDDGENEEESEADKKEHKEKKERDLFHSQIREEMRIGKICLMDTKKRCLWFLPTGAEIAQSTEMWDRMQATQSESKALFASCLNRSAVEMQPPMILCGSQPAKLMTGGIFLTDEEYKAKRESSASAPPGLFSGTPETLARLAIAAPPETTTKTKTKTKKSSSADEWWYQLNDARGKSFATTQAVISVLLEQGRIVSRPDKKLEIVSPTGFVLCSEEYRTFLVPKDFIADPKLSPSRGITPDLSDLSGGITPALRKAVMTDTASKKDTARTPETAPASATAPAPEADSSKSEVDSSKSEEAPVP